LLCYSGTAASGVQRQRHRRVIVRTVVVVASVWRRTSTPLRHLV